MDETIQGNLLSREELIVAMTRLSNSSLRSYELRDVGDLQIPERGAFVGRWKTDRSDPLPELLVVRTEDYADTLAWLNSYLNALTPVSQWCRIIPQSRVADLIASEVGVTLDGRLGAWVGAILAECNAQAPNGINLREVPGNAAISTATFAAGRSAAVWGHRAELPTIAKRHDEVSLALRDGSRPLLAQNIVPLWLAIHGGRETISNGPQRELDPYKRLFERATSLAILSEPAEIVTALVNEADRVFHLPDLLGCARGTQSDRVKSLDQLAQIVAADPVSAANDALVGFAASLVEPGTAILPELLRKFSGRFPVAPLWMGAFAGAISPIRVLSEQQGLGRLVSKSLLAESDLRTRPSSDIAYDELSRWLGAPGKPQKITVRGMAARSVSVELMLGVTCSFPLGRQEPVSTSRPEAIDTRARGGTTPVTSGEFTAALTGLLRRLEKLEDAVKLQSAVEPQLDLNTSPSSSKRASPKAKWKK